MRIKSLLINTNVHVEFSLLIYATPKYRVFSSQRVTMVSDAQCLAKVQSKQWNLEEVQCDFYQERRILSIIYATILLAIYLPTMIYGIYNLFQWKHTVIMQKRHYGLSVAIAILFLLDLIFMAVYIIVYGGAADFQTSGPILTVFIGIYAIIVMYLIFIKVWLHYYDVKFNTISLATSWKSVVNPDASMDTDNWYLKHKQTYGNRKYLLKKLVMLGVIIVLLWLLVQIITTPLLNSNQTTTLDAAIIIMFGVIPIVLTMHIAFCKIPSFHDNFYIKKEAKYIQLVTIFCCALIGGQIIGLYLYDKKARVVAVLTFFFLLATSAFIFVMIVTLWVVRKNYDALTIIKRRSQAASTYRMALELGNAGPGDISPVSSNATTTADTDMVDFAEVQRPKATAMEKLIKNQYGFELLATHLAHEFSMELLLSLIELTQYKQCIHSYVFNNNKGKNENESKNEPLMEISEEDGGQFNMNGCVKFPDEMMPKSRIVYGTLEETYVELLSTKINSESQGINYDSYNLKIGELKVRAYQLYKRYITIGSEHEINVSYNTRKRLIGLMHDIDSWIDNDLDGRNIKDALLFLFKLFDSAIDETRGLLQFSFSRLKASAAYKTYLRKNNDSF